jgi:acyl-CoA thioester hydrolase
MPSASVDIDVPFHDVDLTGYGWHGHVYKYFELARTELMRGLRLDVPDLIALKARVVVVETRARHIKPVRYGDRLTVRVETTTLLPALQLDYEIRNSDGVLVVRGRTTLATVTADGTRLTKTPQIVLERLGATP